MATTERASSSIAKLEAKIDSIRVVLKTWETEYAAAHNGAKPDRDAIRANREMSQQYKTYRHYRQKLDEYKKTAEQPATERSTSGRTDMAPPPSPTKRSVARPPSTPSRNRTVPTFETPTQEPQSPQVPSTIGPTPQKDGRVLGLFSLLGDAGTASPSKKTPGKRKLETGEEREGLFEKGRTPMSASKRLLLDSFMTPTKRERERERGLGTAKKTGEMMFDDLKGVQSPSKDFATPSFLKRRTQHVSYSTGEQVSPVKRNVRRQFTRGLSDLIVGLKGQIDEEYDEAEEAMREAEGLPPRERPDPVAAGGDFPDLPAVPRFQKRDALAEGVGGRRFLSGFDDEGILDDQEQEEIALDRGRPMRQFKKKGQKRTTRKVNIKPTVLARPEGPPEVGDDSVIEETILAEDGEYEDVDDEEGASSKAAKKNTKKKPETEDAAPKKPRKVNELAHANFKRLKLRNFGSKGGPGHNSRFRRRR